MAAFIKICKYYSSAILLLFFVFIAFIETKACDKTSTTINSLVDNGNGTYTITFTACMEPGDNSGCSSSLTITFNSGVKIKSISSNNLTYVDGTIHSAAAITGTSNTLKWSGPSVCSTTNSSKNECFTVSVVLDSKPTSLKTENGRSSCSHDATFPVVKNLTCTSSGGVFTDGSGNYSDDMNEVTTICPDSPGQKVEVTFNGPVDSKGAFSACKPSEDNLYIYQGKSPGVNLVGMYCENASSPGTITSTDPSGCLSFQFISNSSGSASGWDATVKCGCPVTIKPTAPDVCQGAITNLTSVVSGTQGANPKFSWTTASGLTISNNTSSSASINIPKTQATGDYIVKLNYKDDGGCDVTVADTFKVNASPTITGVLAICAGATSQLTGSGTPAANAWSSSLSIVTVSNTGLVTGVNVGKSLITYKDNSGCSRSDTVVVATPDTASVSISASSTIVCPGSTITFTATPKNGGTTPKYQWLLNGSPAGTDSPTFSSSTFINGDYVKVVMTSNAGCVKGSPATSFQINLTSSGGGVKIVADKNPICFGDTITFTATPDNAGLTASYQWKLNGNPVGTDAKVFKSATLINGDKITVVMTASSSCGTLTPVTSNELVLDVKQSPSASVKVTNISCSGLSDGLAIMGANGGTPPFKYSKDGIIFDVGNSFLNLVAGKYSFTVKDFNGCITTIDTAITAPAPIVFIVDPISAEICFGDSVKITATGYTSFNWFNQTAGIKIDSNKTTIKVAPTTNTFYKVISTQCGVSDSVKINVLAPVLIDAIADKFICIGDTASLKAHASGGKGVFNFTWTPAPDFISASGDSASVTPSSLSQITYLLKAQNDCPGYLLSFKVNINPLPIIKIESLPEVCVGEKINFKNTAHQADQLIYNWNFNDGKQSSDLISTNHIYDNPGNYKAELMVTDKNNCKNSDTSQSVLVNASPKAVIINIPGNDLNTNTVVFFTANKSIGDIKKYEWDFDGWGSSISLDTSIAFRDAGTYQVRLIVHNDKCLDTALKTIKILNDYALFVPSTFSPNDDGNNDIFAPKGFGIVNFNMQIWNQWGELVFESQAFDKGWDGVVIGNSIIANQGTYVYKIKFNPIGSETDKPMEKNGHVSLIR